MIWSQKGMKNVVYFEGAVHSLYIKCTQMLKISTTGLSFYLRLFGGFGDYLEAKPVNAASVF